MPHRVTQHPVGRRSRRAEDAANR